MSRPRPVSVPRMTGLLLAGCTLAGIFLAGCGRSDVAASLPVRLPASLEVDPGELRALKTLDYQPVEELAGHRGKPFFVESRTSSLRQYPCTSCHLEPLVLSPEPADARTPPMHLDILLDHATTEVMDCTTCHDPDALDGLRSGNRTGIPFDQAYILCAQCHFQQTRDWAGGAHGKRLGGWAGRRVVLNCTGCHDPHAPAIAPQWPVAYPKVPPSLPPNAHLSIPHGSHHD